MFGTADPRDEARRPQEADGVEKDRVRSGECPDQDAGQPGAGERRCGSADLELRVAVDELVSVDERGQVRLVRDVEEHRADADEEADGVELPDGERVEGIRDRHRRQCRCSPEVAEDEDRLASQPIDPDPCRQREEQERKEFDGSEQGNLEGARLEDQDRGERQRELRDLRAELADRLRRPEPQEVRVSPESAGRPRSHVKDLRFGRADRRLEALRAVPSEWALPRSARACRGGGAAVRAGSRGLRGCRRQRRS